MPDLKHTHEGASYCTACDIDFIERRAPANCRTALDRITAALAEREAAGWVLTSERMPEAGQPVFFFTGGKTVEDGHWKPNEWVALDGARFKKVALWHPRIARPAPPSPPTTIEEK